MTASIFCLLPYKSTYLRRASRSAFGLAAVAVGTVFAVTEAHKPVAPALRVEAKSLRTARDGTNDTRHCLLCILVSRFGRLLCDSGRLKIAHRSYYCNTSAGTGRR